MNKNCHPNYLSAGHSLLTVLRSGAEQLWDDTSLEPRLDLNIVIARAYVGVTIALNTHFPLTEEGVNDALDCLANFRRERKNAKR